MVLRSPITVLLFLAGSAISAQELPPSLAKHFSPPAEWAGKMGNYHSPLKFNDGREVTTSDDWKLRRQEILKTWHDLMGPWPAMVEKPTAEVLKEDKRENFQQYHLKLQIAPDRYTEDCHLLVPEGKGPFPAVVVVFYDSKTGIGLGKSAHRDFAYQLVKRGFVALSLGSTPGYYYPSKEKAQLQSLSFHAYEAATCHTYLAQHPLVDPARIGIVGHSYGGKWAMFAACLYDKFAATAWSDGGIVFDETRSNVNYWEPWYLGYQPDLERKPGIPNASNPRTGAYKTMLETGRDLHALMAPRPFLVSGGSEDFPARWQALNHAVAVNKLLGFSNRVGMTNRPAHDPNEESNQVLGDFFVHFLGTKKSE